MKILVGLKFATLKTSGVCFGPIDLEVSSYPSDITSQNLASWYF